MKTLIVYGSKYGATKVCAERIANLLKGEVEILNLAENQPTDLAKYDKVLMGSSVYAGQLQKEVKSFYDNNKEVLKGKKIGMFLCCLNDKLLNEYIDGALGEAFRKELIAQVGCGGALNFNKMNFFERFVTKKIAKSMQNKGELSKDIAIKGVVEVYAEERIRQFVALINQS
ncbi:MAG: flavodoxin domain-containing protein [Cellulosilyticaceae bacterium]